MKFDVIVANPPYQANVKENSGGSGSGSNIYNGFISLALKLTSDDGFICMVHPNAWRRPNEKQWQVLRNKKFHYLEIHDKKDGSKMFSGHITRYDWYVMQNKNVESYQTTVKDEKGGVHSLDLSEWPFLPNFDFDLIKSILAKTGEKCQCLYDYSAYEARQSWMNKEKTPHFCHPCVSTTPQSGVNYIYSSRRDKLFGIPKVIFGDGDTIKNAVVDWNGEYGMGSHAMGIVISSEDEGKQVKKALETDQFNRLLKACRWSNFQIDWRLFGNFRKDFWKSF